VSQDGIKVLGILWADGGLWEVTSFQRGPWEDAALNL